MNCILIDDEFDCLDLLELLIIRHCPDLKIIGTYNDGHAGTEAIREHRPDLVFLDVEMPKLDGFGVLEACRNIPFQVVFTTAYEHYAAQAFRYSAIDYLLKPIQKEQLKEATNRARQLRKSSYYTEQREILFDYIHPTKPSREKIALPTSDGIAFLSIRDIIYCASDGNYTEIYIGNNSKQIYTILLKEIEDMLSGHNFYRVHNSFVVNMEKVDQYIKSDSVLQMTNQSRIPVSRQKKEKVLQVLMSR